MFISSKHHWSTKRIFVFVTVFVLIAISAQSAFASPIDDKRKKAAQLAQEIEANGDKISALAESYNYTQIKLSDLKTSVNDAQAQLDSAQSQNDEVKARVQKRAVEMYSGSSDTNAEVANPADSIRKNYYANIATGNDSSTLTQLQITKETVTDRKAELEKQLSSISEQEKSLAAQKKSIEDANKKQQDLLNQTKGELATLIAQEQARQARARAATVRAATPKTTKKSGSSNQTLPSNLPAPSPKAAIAIEFARQQLGKPYRYAAAGPDSYDCSGLTMRAYGAAGLKLPHYSGAQYAMFPKVPIDQLQPGDLVFRGPGGSQHVALYIGNGLIITAPQTGDVVKIASIGRTIGGVRPG
ncbi:MAG: NlpC/P60 family protein [Acidimicrobiia bacterium]